MAAKGGSGMNAMVNGKSAYKQFMVRQGKDNYLRKIYSAKPTIDNKVPNTFKSKLQSNGRLPKQQQHQRRQRPQSARELELTSTQRNLTLPLQQQQPSGDLLESHRENFTPAANFTPRINKRPGVVTQSRLLSSGLFVPVRKRPQSATNMRNDIRTVNGKGNNSKNTSRRFDGTYDVIDGVVDNQLKDERSDVVATETDPLQQQRTVDWLQNIPPEPSVYESVFSKIDENYIEFAEAIIKEISTSGVTSNRMINIIMRKHTEMHRRQLNIGKMEHVCKLIGDYLSVNEELDDDQSYTEPFQPLVNNTTASPLTHSPTVTARAMRVADDEKTQTVTELTEVSQIDDDNRTATPLDDFHQSLRAQLHDVSELENKYSESEQLNLNATINSNADDRSIEEFNDTLHHGQFESLQTLSTNDFGRQKTVRFS